MSASEREPNAGAGPSEAAILWAAATLAILASIAAFLLWGFNGADIILEMVAFYCG